MTHTESFRATPPAIEPARHIQLPELRTISLASGMRLCIYDRCDSPVNYLTIVSHGGSSEAKSPGEAALTSIMLREGSSKYTSEAIASALDFNGSWLRCVPNVHHLCTSMYSLNTRLGEVLPIFVDMLRNPRFPQKEFEVRRESLARNIEVAMQDVNYQARCLSDKQIMGENHPIAITDTPECIRAMSAEQLADFYTRYCQLNGATIYLCGHITKDIEDLVIDTFNGIAASSTGGSEVLNICPYEPVAAGCIERIPMPNAQQSAVMMTLPAIPRTHPHYIPLHLTVAALGGYFGSRLMLNIREQKGLTYGITASLPGNIDDSHILISAETDNVNVEALIDEVRAEMLRLVTEPCTGDELTRLKQATMASMSAVLDSPFATIDYHISQQTCGIPVNYFNDKVNTALSLTPDTISSMAKLYLQPNKLRIAICGDITKM